MRRFVLGVLLCWCWLPPLVWAVSACPSVLTMAYNSSWQPYIVVSDEHVTGTDVQFVEQLLAANHMRLKLVYTPEKRALQQLQQGGIDLLFGASYTAERAAYAYFSKPYRVEKNTIVVHQQTLAAYPGMTVKSAFMELAQRKLIGTYNPAGFYGDEFERLKQNPQVKARSVFVFEGGRRLELVSSQRADYTIADQQAMEYELSHQSVGKGLLLMPFSLNEAPIHLMFSKATVTADCVAELNQHIQS